MADIADHANDLAQLQLDVALAARKKPAAIVFTGLCLNCGEPVSCGAPGGVPQRWCDEDCRDDHQARLRREGGLRS